MGREAPLGQFPPSSASRLALALCERTTILLLLGTVMTVAYDLIQLHAFHLLHRTRACFNIDVLCLFFVLWS